MPDSSTALIDFLSDIGPKRLREVDQVLLANSSSTTSYLASQLERETTLLDNLSRGLKSRRNECCRLLRLPPEILGEILTIVSQADPPHARALDSHGPRRTEAKKEDAAYLGFITVGHVCRHLREQLLSLRALWAAIVFSLPSKAAEKEILRRAKDVPLVISLNDGYHTPLHHKISSQKLFQAARVINIGDAVPHLSPYFWPFSPKELPDMSFPLLEELTLRLSIERTGPTQEYVKPEVYDLPPINAPRLRRLALQDYFIPFNPQNLTSLELVYLFHPSDDVLLPPARFWDILNNGSNLRRLILDSCLPEITLTTNEPSTAIHFPRLQELRIGDTIDRARALWTHIRVPSTADLEFRLSAAWGRVPDSPGPEDLTSHETSFFRFITALTPHVRAATATRPVYGLGVYDDVQDGDGAHFVLATRSPGAHFQDESGPFSRDTAFMLAMSLSSPMSNYVHVDIINMLRRVIADYSLDAIEVFEFVNSHSYEESRVIETLQSLSTVHTLVLDAFPDLAQVLGVWNVVFFPGTPENTRPLLFPNLHTLWVVEVIYTTEDAEEEEGHREHGENGELEHPAQTPWSLLLDGLASRGNRGSPLQRFVSHAWRTDDHEATKRMIARLTEHVESVEVDVKLQDRRNIPGHPYFHHPAAMLNGLNIPNPAAFPFPVNF